VLLLVPLVIVWRLYPRGTEGRPLDGGPLLATTALLWALALVGPALTVGQQSLSEWAFHRPMSIQVEVPVTEVDGKDGGVPTVPADTEREPIPPPEDRPEDQGPQALPG